MTEWDRGILGRLTGSLDWAAGAISEGKWTARDAVITITAMEQIFLEAVGSRLGVDDAREICAQVFPRMERRWELT